MWTEANTLWQQRNESLHDPNNTIQRRDLEQQIRDLYDKDELVLAEDRGIFDVPLQERLRHHTQQLHDFIQVQGATIAHSIQQKITRATANFRRITDFFRPR